MCVQCVVMSDTSGGPSFGHGEALEAVSGYLGAQLETFGEAIEDFQDSSQEWRRLFSELLGTFFLVLVAAGGLLSWAGRVSARNREQEGAMF